MSSKIFRSILLAALVVLLSAALIIVGVLYEYFGGLQEEQLGDELKLAAAGVSQSGQDYLTGVSDSSYRLTWIQADGTVLYDSEADAASLPNHADRDEVKQALASGTGESTRYSDTLLEKTLYRACRLADGTVLRISASRATAWYLVLGMLQPILAVLAAALILSWVLAKKLSKRIVEPLNRLDLEHPLDNSGAYEELSPLLRRIASQREELNAQLRTLRQKTDEFNETIRNMREGLVLLDEHGKVLSINRAAETLFSADVSCIGQDFLTVERAHEVSRAIEKAIADGHSETRYERDGRAYQLDVSRIDSDGVTVGTVLLSFDVTEKEYAEQSRREFTANVSHELKTPLQGIIGSAELIESGMAKPEDVPRFIGHIRTEAARMVTLIGDIIRLSQLDEGGEMPHEEVEVLTIAREAQNALDGEADKKHISLTTEGEPVRLTAVRRLVYEIIYNICDNAIKYNVENGSVCITVGQDGGEAFIRVADTGIGIPKKDQERIFERFYRVDKSHSKASGGTGLGLSIVKHAVLYLNGHIDLTSEMGKGTTITIKLPMNNK